MGHKKIISVILLTFLTAILSTDVYAKGRRSGGGRHYIKRAAIAGLAVGAGLAAHNAYSSSRNTTSNINNFSAPLSSTSSGYYTGRRGGCYTITASGAKRYVDHSFCQ